MINLWKECKSTINFMSISANLVFIITIAYIFTTYVLIEKHKFEFTEQVLQDTIESNNQMYLAMKARFSEFELQDKDIVVPILYGIETGETILLFMYNKEGYENVFGFKHPFHDKVTVEMIENYK